MKAISVGYIIAGVFFQTIQTTLTAVAWYYILAAGYPDGGVRYRDILAAYAAGVAMNGFLPANIGTIVSLLMYVALIRGSTFAGVLGATVVQKIFYTFIGIVVYLYLFLSVPGTFDLQLGVVSDHRFLVPLLIIGAVVLIVLLVKAFWSRIEGLWEKAKQGGAILSNKRDYVIKVLLPLFGSWLAKLAVIAVFLAAYRIPVTFHTVMSVVGGNSLANSVSFTPGGVGVTQAMNTSRSPASRAPTNAAAYSLGQQLIVTAWNCVFALVMVVWVFGYTGGKQLVGQSYTDAKVKAAEQSAAHKARRAAEERRPSRRATRPESRREAQPKICHQIGDREDPCAAAAPDQVRDEPRPARLVRGAQPGAVVAVEVLVEQDLVAPARVGLHPLDAAEARPPPVRVRRGTSEIEPGAQVVGDLVQRGWPPRAGRVLDRAARRRRSGGSGRARVDERGS